MATVLLTGFEAFGNTPINPAERVVRILDGASIAGATVIGRIVPSKFFKSIDAVKAAMDEVKPDIVIMMGEYGGRATVTVERLAHNLNDSTRYGLADNEGCALEDTLTAPDGPVAYYATAPIRAMVKAMRAAGIPSDVSDTPGTFCCNHLMYGVLHDISERGLAVRAGWIHLPHLPEVAALEANLGAPSMSVETSTAAVEAGIRAAIAHRQDIHEPIRSRWQI